MRNNPWKELDMLSFGYVTNKQLIVTSQKLRAAPEGKATEYWSKGSAGTFF
jgi:hypothetical protein